MKTMPKTQVFGVFVSWAFIRQLVCEEPTKWVVFWAVQD